MSYDPSSPIDIARAVFLAVEEQRWSDAVALFHPESVARFREVKLEEARRKEKLARERPLMAAEFAMPPEVAAWFQEHQRQVEEQVGRNPVLWRFDVTSLEEMRALPAAELLARWIRMRDPRESMKRQHERRGDDANAPERFVPPVIRRTAEAVAQVDDDTAHVIYRLHGPSVQRDAGQPQVLTMRHSDDGWRVWEDAGAEGLLGGGAAISVALTPADRLPVLRAAADRVVSWAADEAHAGKAWIAGWNGTATAPEALRIEVRGNGGDPTVVDVPQSAFRSLVDVLMCFAELPPKS